MNKVITVEIRQTANGKPSNEESGASESGVAAWYRVGGGPWIKSPERSLARTERLLEARLYGWRGCWTGEECPCGSSKQGRRGD